MKNGGNQIQTAEMANKTTNSKNVELTLHRSKISVLTAQGKASTSFCITLAVFPADLLNSPFTFFA